MLICLLVAKYPTFVCASYHDTKLSLRIYLYPIEHIKDTIRIEIPASLVNRRRHQEQAVINYQSPHTDLVMYIRKYLLVLTENVTRRLLK